MVSKANRIAKIPPPIFFSHKENIHSAIEHRQNLSRTVFRFEFQDVAYSLKVASTTFLLVCFVYLKKRSCETRKNVFYFPSKALFVLEIINFSGIQML